LTAPSEIDGAGFGQHQHGMRIGAAEYTALLRRGLFCPLDHQDVVGAKPSPSHSIQTRGSCGFSGFTGVTLNET